jgi:hypothetical protein
VPTGSSIASEGTLPRRSFFDEGEKKQQAAQIWIGFCSAVSVGTAHQRRTFEPTVLSSQSYAATRVLAGEIRLENAKFLPGETALDPVARRPVQCRSAQSASDCPPSTYHGKLSEM